ncbi:uncharacterized protein LOC125720614 [Brienomyrus brachyistius]|uniref:uncharacterized protein LOC125720614 n=1 Tax=Brienomyrus brachyistius TaxID=42636 RepID=UPI0020B21441|nr:uncharacterized protein LOC125720614 [Brienomyrus brachyistius]
MKTSTAVSLSMLSLLVLASSSPVTVNTPIIPHSQVLTTHPSNGVQNTTSHSEKQTNTATTNITKTTSRAASLPQLSVSTDSTTSSTSGGVRGTPDNKTHNSNSWVTPTVMVILFLVFCVGLLFLIWWLWRPQGRRWARDTTRATVRRLRLWGWPQRRESGAEECAADDGSSLGGEEMGEGLKVGEDDEGQTEGQSSTDGEEEEVQKESATQMEKQPHDDIMIEDDQNQEDGRDVTIL